MLTDIQYFQKILSFVLLENLYSQNPMSQLNSQAEERK